MSAATTETPLYDRTARQAHQWTMVAMVVAGLILQGVPGGLLLTLAGVIMLAGRFWWPADVVRQLVWRVLEPAGILKRDDVHEDHETRRIARVLGGTIWLIAAASLLAENPILAWVLTLPIAVMVGLDGSVDFCALCFVVAQLNRRGILRRAGDGRAPHHPGDCRGRGCGRRSRGTLVVPSGRGAVALGAGGRAVDGPWRLARWPPVAGRFFNPELHCLPNRAVPGDRNHRGDVRLRASGPASRFIPATGRRGGVQGPDRTVHRAVGR